MFRRLLKALGLVEDDPAPIQRQTQSAHLSHPLPRVKREFRLPRRPIAKSMSDPTNPNGWTHPNSPNNPHRPIAKSMSDPTNLHGWTHPFSPNNPNGMNNPSNPNSPMNIHKPHMKHTNMHKPHKFK